MDSRVRSLARSRLGDRFDVADGTMRTNGLLRGRRSRGSSASLADSLSAAKLAYSFALPRIVLMLLLLPLVGCQSYAARMEVARRQYYGGQIDAALAEIDKAERSYDSSKDVTNLDRSIVLLANGRAEEAEQLLRDVRDHLESLEEKRWVDQGVSMLTDDTRQPYAGEDYEKVLLRVFLALANLMRGGDDVEAYALQVMDKQQQIIDAAADEEGKNPKAAYQQVAVGAYLRGILREQSHTDYDDAARAFEAVAAWQPDFAPGKSDLERVSHGHHSQRGHGVVHLFALVGRGPQKVEVAEVPTSQAMLVADQVFSVFGNQTVPPTLAPIKVPKVVPRQNLIDGVGVRIARNVVGLSQPITHVTQMAIAQAEAMHDHTIGVAVARRAIKKGMIYGAKEFAGVQKGSLIGLGVDLAGVAYEAIEHADTRSWSLLPDSIQVLRLELPAGTHSLGLAPLDRAGRSCGPEVVCNVSVADGRNTYVLANFPGEKLVGQVQVTRP